MRVLMAWCMAIAGIAVVVDRVATPDAVADECVLTALLVNPCRPMLGANAGNYPNVTAGYRPQLEGHEARIGRTVDVVHLYHVPGTRPLDEIDSYFATRPNTILSVTWKPAELWADAGGSSEVVNAQIDAAADDLIALGTTKVMLTLHHEPENDVTGGASGCTYYSGDYGTPAEYRAMWRNVRDRFDAKGVTNVVWVMNYMGFVEWDCMVDDLWPGNDLVDWVVWDPYTDSVPWAQTVGRFYDYLENASSPEYAYASKPWGLGEWSVWRNATQAFTYQYYEDARASVAAGAFPRLKLYSVFDNAVTTPRTSRIGYDSKGNFDQTEIDHYAAFANDPSMVGEWSFMPVVTDVDAPTVPAGLEITGATPSQVWLRWQGSTDDVGVDHYEVRRDGVVVGADVSDVTFVDATVAAGSAYTYDVRAVDAAGNASASSDPIVADVPVPAPDTEPPAAPEGLTAVQTMSDAVHLEWTAAIDDVGVHHYELLRDGALVATDLPGLAHVDGAVQPDTDFTFQVRAVDAAGNVGAPSTELAVRTPPLPDTTPPTAPTDLSAIDLAPRSVVVGWQPATDEVGVDHYEVLRAGWCSTWSARARSTTSRWCPAPATRTASGRSMRRATSGRSATRWRCRPPTPSHHRRPRRCARRPRRSPTSASHGTRRTMMSAWCRTASTATPRRWARSVARRSTTPRCSRAPATPTGSRRSMPRATSDRSATRWSCVLPIPPIRRPRRCRCRCGRRVRR